MNLGIPMVRRKKFRKCVLKEMSAGSTRKDATLSCKKTTKKESRRIIKNED